MALGTTRQPGTQAPLAPWGQRSEYVPGGQSDDATGQSILYHVALPKTQRAA